jgi:hypothetical protein
VVYPMSANRHGSKLKKCRGPPRGIVFDETNCNNVRSASLLVLEEKSVHVPSELLDVLLKHTGLDAAYLPPTCCLQEINCLACLERNG